MSAITAIAFAPSHNRPKKKDADYFRREAGRFLEYYKQPESNLIVVDNTKTPFAMRRKVLSTLRKTRADMIAFFCHGPTSGRIQFGFGVGNVAVLAKALAKCGGPEVIVPLYCCLVGKPGAFAEKLRDSLCVNGCVPCRVCANTTSGKTSLNPYKVFYDGMSEHGGPGAIPIVSSTNKALWSKWKDALASDLRFAFPVLSLQEIHDRL